MTSSSNANSTSASITGLTTLELHPNVVLGLGQDDDDQHSEFINRPHLCSICHATYKTKTHLRRHMLIHMNSRPFPCQHCGKGFNRREHLNKHLEAVHSGQKHSCPYCHKEISRLDHLKRHIKNMHTDKKSNKASKGPVLKVQMGCGQRQRAEIAFMTPEISSGTLGQTIITSIPMGSNGSIVNESDKMVKSKQKGTQSHIGEAGTSDPGETPSFSPSMTINPSNILGSCQGIATISVQSTPTQKLLVHQRLPLGSELNMNTPNGFANLANVNLSLNEGVTEDEGESQIDGSLQIEETTNKKPSASSNNVCIQCNATFSSGNDLASHIKSHKVQPHRCPECPRAYTRREKLTEHIRCVHQGLKFSCEYCGKKLSRKDHVLRHIRSVHPEVYAAGLCDMDDGFITLDDQGKLVDPKNSFSLISPSSGKRRRLSNGEFLPTPSIGDVGVLLRNVCQICFKVFGTAYHLTRHIESCHSGDVRPFSCESCDKMFKRKDHLTKHVKSHCPILKERAWKEPAINIVRTPEPVSDSTVTSSSSSLTARTDVKYPDTKYKSKDQRDSRSSFEGTRNNSNTQLPENHTILQTLQVTRNQSNSGIISQHELVQGESSTTPGGTALIVNNGSLQTKHSDHTEYNLAVIDSFMQGNVNVVVVDEDISKYLQHSSSSHLTTTFPCGQCQKVFHSRDHLIAHLQEHATGEGVLPPGHLSDINFSNF